MFAGTASTQSRFSSGGYRGSDNSSDYHSKFYNSRLPSYDAYIGGGTLPRRLGGTSSIVRPLPVGPISNGQYDSSSPSSASVSSTSSSIRSIPIRYNDSPSTTSTLGRRPTMNTISAASSKPPLPSSAYERVSSSLGNSKYLNNSPDLRHQNVSIGKYLRSSSSDRSSTPISGQRNHYTDDQYRRPPIDTNALMQKFDRISEQLMSRPSSAAISFRRPSFSERDDYLLGRSPSPLSNHRNYMNGTSTIRTVPIYYDHRDRQHEDEERDVVASLMTSPSASGGIGNNANGSTAVGSSMSPAGLYRSRTGAVSVPDVPSYARNYVEESNANSNTSNNGYSRWNGPAHNSLERQELEDDEEDANSTKEAKEEAELRRKYSPGNYRRPSEERSTSTVNNESGSTNSGAFVKNEPSRSSTSSVDSSESSRFSSGRSSNISDLGSISRCSDASRFIRDDGGNDSKKFGLVGLRNLGNTCFMNSVIQCLSNTRPLRDYCLQSSSTLSTDINNNTTSRMKGALIKAFRELLSELWNTTKGGQISPDRFKTQIQKFAPRFTGYSQQDAQEFLRYLLQGLHEDINRVQTRPPALPPIEDNLPDSQKALESWKRYLRVDESKIVDIFVGQLKSELKCTHCGHASTTYDPFWDLSLPIPQDNRRNQVTLNDCLDAFTKEEVMDGDEKPTCEACKTRRRCTKKFSIQKYPSILVLHLKRFSGERYRSRLSTLVEFPLTRLDLSPYAAMKSNVTPTYDLYAVSNHCGTPLTGHYTAYCKHTQSDRWYLFDDTRVTPVNDRSVVSSEAYVLYYELSTTGSSSRL